MKLTDADLISKLLSLPERELSELLALLADAPADPARTGTAAAAVPAWASAGAGAAPRPGGQA